MIWGDGVTRGAATERDVAEVPIIDRRDAMLTIRVTDEQIPVEGALIDGVDAAGVAIATLVVRRRIVDEEATLGVLEVVEGDAVHVQKVRWPVWRTPDTGGAQAP
jgi:hypothetical protein